MSTITLRSTKGLPLTNTEVDNNFSNLNTDKLEFGGTYSTGTANGVPYLNGSKVLTSGSALTFDGSSFVQTAAGTAYSKVRSSGTGTVVASLYQNADTGTTDSDGFFVGTVGNTPYIYNYENSPIIFATNNSEKMRLTSTGLGIGTSSPATALDVTGTITSDGLTVDGSILYSGAGIIDAENSALYHRASTSQYFQTTSSNTNRATINANGDISFYDDTGTSQAFYWDASAESLGIGTSSPTNKLTVSGNANITGNTTLGDASTDTVTVNGYMGVGATPAANIGIRVARTLTGNSQEWGVYADPTFDSSATVLGGGVGSKPATAATSFTVPNIFGFRSLDVTKGAGSTITNQHGLYIDDQTQGTNNYGITSLVSSGTNKWNIYASGTAANYFAGNVGVGNTLSAWDTAGSSKAIQYGNNGVGSLYAYSTLLNSLGYNYYRDSTPLDKYVTTNSALRYTQNYLSGHQFLTAPSGTAGANITWSERLTLGFTEAVFNDTGNDYDFRVESDNNTHALFVEGSSGNVGIGTSSPRTKLDVYAGEAIISNGTAGTPSTGGTLWLNTGTSGTTRSAAIQSISTGTSNDHSLLFYTNAAASSPVERLRIDSSGNLGIGTSSPTEKLTIAGNIASSTSGTFYLDGTNPGSAGNPTYSWVIDTNTGMYRPQADTLGLATNGTERARITSDGYLRMASGTGGIQFNGDTAAANALDDYEEGTFTPVITGSASNPTVTYATQQASYVKVGKVVTAAMRLLIATISGGSGYAKFSLPFTAASGNGWMGAVRIEGASGIITYNLVASETLGGQGECYLRANTNPTGAGADVQVSNLIANTRVYITLTYEVA